jgi:hypothetical protein
MKPRFGDVAGFGAGNVAAISSGFKEMDAARE